MLLALTVTAIVLSACAFGIRIAEVRAEVNARLDAANGGETEDAPTYLINADEIAALTGVAA